MRAREHRCYALVIPLHGAAYQVFTLYERSERGKTKIYYTVPIKFQITTRLGTNRAKKHRVLQETKYITTAELLSEER